MAAQIVRAEYPKKMTPAERQAAFDGSSTTDRAQGTQVLLLPFLHVI